jgi:hypothetical protein
MQRDGRGLIPLPGANDFGSAFLTKAEIMRIQKITVESICKIMNTHRTAPKLMVTSLALLLVGATIAAVIQRESVPVTRVHLCVKDNGQLRILTDKNTTCDPTERLMDAISYWGVNMEEKMLLESHHLIRDAQAKL